MLPLLLLLPQLINGQGCCPKKLVGADEYMYSNSNPGEVEGFGCFDSCVYLKNGQPGDRYCFGPGDLDVVCDAGEKTTPSSATSGCQCGRKKESRIVGGQDAEVNEWPWMVGMALAFMSNATGELEELQFKYICGGTLIAEEWVVTAAHCFFDPRNGERVIFEKDLRLWIGDHDKSTIDETSISDTFGVAEIILHPTYNGTTFKDDIALMRVATKVNLNKHAPACLPEEGETFTNQTAYAYGWGALKFNSSEPPPDILQEAELPILDFDNCTEAYGYANLQLSDGMLCAGGDGTKGTCQGDSGGPLTVANSEGRHVLVGATSWGIGCAEVGFPGVFAEISFYRTTFIDATINSKGGATFCPA